MNQIVPRTLQFNWRGGLTGTVIFFALWGSVFFVAFMTALGNDTPQARLILQGIEIFGIIANPVWGLPCAYVLGAYLFRQKE
jgi:hypothetical protein